MKPFWALFFCGVASTSSFASNAGKDWGIERKAYRDPVTHVRVWELTAGQADNLYYHISNFTADNRFLIFASERTGTSQLYRAEIETGRIVQLTDGPAVGARGACPDPANASLIYFLRGPEVFGLDILNFTEHKIGEIPLPHIGGFQQPTLSGDRKWLALTKQRDAANWEIGLMNIATGEYRPVITQGFRIGHVQHSPTDPIIFYAWETSGYAPQRSWLVNTDGTGNRPFYARTERETWFTPLKEWVTHEAWVKDTGDMTMVNDKLGIMLVKKEGSARMVGKGKFWHAAARADGKKIVVDDAEGRLWLMETETGKTRLLATGIRDGVHAVHAHASFDRVGRYVQFHTGRIHETIALIDLNDLPAEK